MDRGKVIAPHPYLPPPVAAPNTDLLFGRLHAYWRALGVSDPAQIAALSEQALRRAAELPDTLGLDPLARTLLAASELLDDWLAQGSELPRTPQRLAAIRAAFFVDLPNLSPNGRTLASRIGAGGAGDLNPDLRRFVIDFGGEALSKLPDDAPVQAVVSASTGKVKSVVAHKNSHSGGWRLSFELEPQGSDPSELRCFLKLGEDVLTETWSYQWTAVK